MSSLGKGIIASSLGANLEWLGYSVKYQKLDPYLNTDSGLMAPSEHGECFVMDDGTECDMDFGHFERFTSFTTSKKSSVTTGGVYNKVLTAERKGDYLGKTVQVIPHITNEIQRLITDQCDFKIIELGGTIGDIESNPYVEAIRQFKRKNNVTIVMLTYIVHLMNAGEFKTKPAQQSIAKLRELGLDPDVVIARSHLKPPQSVITKLQEFAMCPTFLAEDLDNVYKIPLNFWDRGVTRAIINNEDAIWKLPSSSFTPYEKWNTLVKNVGAKKIKIAIAGKYSNSTESYKSVNEAIYHACCHLNLKPEIIPWSEDDTDFDLKVAGVIIPGGFGSRGIQMKLNVLRWCRERNVPALGICYGMQLMAIEYAQNVLGIEDAISEEWYQGSGGVIPDFTHTPIIRYMPGQQDVDKGASMRLGKYKLFTINDTPLRTIYGQTNAWERHRHRLEFLAATHATYFSKSDLKIGAISDASSDFEDVLVEATYLKDHPFYIGLQAHPEFRSRFLEPHPLFTSFIKASYDAQKTADKSII